MDYITFYNTFNGTGWDIDGYFGNQCLIKGTYVTLFNGLNVPIETVRVGDRLKGGNYVVFNNPKKSDTVHIETKTGNLYVTKEHRFIMEDGGEKCAYEICVGDVIKLDTEESPYTLDLTEQELKFLGIWLADGTKSYRQNQIMDSVFLTIGTDKKIEYVSDLHLSGTWCSHSNGKAKIFYLAMKEYPVLVNFINTIADKNLPQIFTKEQYKHIIEGYMIGDGCQKNKGYDYQVATSTSKGLLLSIQHGCILNGWSAKLSRPQKRKKTNLCENPKDLYRLTISPNREPIGRVIKVSENQRDTIYILNTDGDHLYYAENHKHHNCWDGYAKYCIEMGIPFAYCTSSGYVKDIWENRQTNGILNYCDEVTTLQPGDIVVFTENAYTPYSHVAIFHRDIDGQQGYFLGQNQGGYDGNFNLCALPYWTTYPTAFRLKKSAPSLDPVDELVQEDGIAKLIVDGVRARLNSPNGDVVRIYREGDELRYYWKWIGNGHRYIVWKEDDNYIFLAVSGSEDRSDMWAEFREPDGKEGNPSEDDFGENTTKPSVSELHKGKAYGIDISQHNGDFDITGQDFVIIRASYGVFEDGWFRGNVKKCEEKGIPYGVYVYDYAYDVDGGVEQAEYVLNLIKGCNVTCGVWFDIEDADGFKEKNGLLSREHITGVVNAFTDVIESAGYFVGIYSTPSWFETYMPDIKCKNRWIAHWNINDGAEHDDFSDIGIIHQYTSVPHDKNVSYVDLEHFKNPKEHKEEQEPQEEPNEEEEIKNGLWYWFKRLIYWIRDIFRDDD